MAATKAIKPARKLERVNEYEWKTKARLKCWGNKTLEIKIPTDEENVDPSDRQLETLAALVKLETDLREAFETEAFRYYAGSVYGSFTLFNSEGVDEAEKCAPALGKPSDIWKLVEKPLIQIDGWTRNPSKLTIDLHIECSWDPDHGFGALFEDWELTGLGSAGETLPISEMYYARDDVLSLSMRKRTLDDAALERFLRGNDKITDLNLDGCAKLTDRSLAAVGKLHKLERLNLCGCSRITDEGVSHLRDLGQLTTLTLDECYNLTDAGMRDLSGLKKLNWLTFSDAPKLKDEGLVNLSKLKKLDLLAFENCPGISDAGVRHLAKIRPLGTLLLKRCSGITQDSLPHLQTMKHLDQLSLWGCKGIRKVDIKALKKKLRNVGVTF